MPIIDIDGVGHVEVDSSFFKASPEEQKSYVEGIQRSYQAGHSSSDEAEQAAQSDASPSPAPAPAPVQDTPQAPQAPQAPQPTQPESSLSSALKYGLTDELPAALWGGAATLARSIAPSTLGTTADYFTKKAAADRQDMAQNYKRPDDVDTSPTRAFANQGAIAALRSLGYGAAENAGKIAPAIGAAFIPGIGIPLAASIGAVEGADQINEGKRAAGLEADKPFTGGDWANLAAQTAINAIPVGKVLPKELGAGAVQDFMRSAQLDSLLPAVQAGSNIAYRTAQSAGKQGMANLENNAALALQGGDVGSQADVARNAFDAALTGAAVHLPGELGAAAAKSGARLGQAARDASVVDRNALNELIAYHNGDIQADQLSPAAQQMQAARNLYAFIDPRTSAERGVNSTRMSDSIGSDLDLGVNQVTGMADSLKKIGKINGGVDSQGYDTIMSALKAAKQSNRTLASSGKGAGYTNGEIDNIRSLGLDPEVENTLIERLKTIDDASFNKKVMNQQTGSGKVLNAIGQTLLGNSGKAIGGIAYGVPGMAAGTLLDALGAGLRTAAAGRVKSIANSLGSKWDNAVGGGSAMPPIFRNMGSISRVMDKKGLQPTVTPQEVQSLLDSLQDIAGKAQAQRATRGSTPLGMRPQVSPQAAPQPQVAPQGQPQEQPQAQPQAPMQEAPQQATTQQAAPQAAPQPDPQQAPQPEPQSNQASPQFNLGNLDMSQFGQKAPGWMGSSGAGQQEPNSVRIRNLLANMVEAGKIPMDQYHFLMTNDHVGDNLGQIQGIINYLQALPDGGKAYAEATTRAEPGSAPKGYAKFVQDYDKAQQQRVKEATGTDQGTAPTDNKGNPIRSMFLYQQKAEQNARLASNIAALRPDLAEVAQQAHDARSKTAKRAIIEQFVAGLPKGKKAAARTLLTPLIKFGQEE